MSRRQHALAAFDLDRTLLRTSSTPLLTRHLRAVGLGPDHEIPGAALLQLVYATIGETRPLMELSRIAVRASAGWPVDTVGRAAANAVDELEELVNPYARELIDEHRRAGRVLVIATTTPLQFVEPLARRLGIDDVIATRWASRDDRYTGELDGPFIWGRAKRDAVRAFARQRGASLACSHAYSDSYFDAPLLDAVGHPTAVNPDPRLLALALLQGWPIRHLDAPEGVVKVAGLEVQELLRPIARNLALPNVHFEITGIENIPGDGGALVCANHRSYFDAPTLALLLAKAGRTVRFLAKRELFDVPGVGRFVASLGAIPVDRGTGSEEPLERAAQALRGGDLVAIMPQGTIPRGPAFFEPELQGRWGAARLAAGAGVPVIPVGLWGTEDVWPRNARVPRLGSEHTVVRVRVGRPLRLGGRSPAGDTKRLMRAITELLPPEARVPRTPTAEELARTFPHGSADVPSG